MLKTSGCVVEQTCLKFAHMLGNGDDLKRVPVPKSTNPSKVEGTVTTRNITLFKAISLSSTQASYKCQMTKHKKLHLHTSKQTANPVQCVASPHSVLAQNPRRQKTQVEALGKLPVDMLNLMLFVYSCES